MVKVINPLLSHSASGRIAGIVYETGRYGTYAKTHTPQRKKPSDAQIQQNLYFGEASDSWRELTDEQKKEWNQKASGLKMTGYNLFIKENIEHP